METKLSASYVDPTEPGSLGGIAKFAKAHKIPQSNAKKELQQVLSYTLHKPRHRRFKTLPTLVFKHQRTICHGLGRFAKTSQIQQRLQIFTDGD